MQAETYMSAAGVDTGPWLRSARWDRIFILGGALLVPIPILAYYLFRAAGASVGASEDLVTLLVMVAVGGPHVFATYTRTFLNPTFYREDRRWVIGGVLVIALVVTAATLSAFHDATIMGFPPIQFVLTFFFFWAGIHIVHQMSYCVACYARQSEKKRARSYSRPLDYLVMLGCLYPVSFFRMSMIDPVSHTTNADALASRIVLHLSGSQEFTSQYLFRIGRTAPILPDFMVADWFWVTFAVLYFTTLCLWLLACRRDAGKGVLIRPRFQLVGVTVLVGLVVPLFPNLDSAFQGFNAWHSFQYIGLLWLMNRVSWRRGEIRNGFVRRISEPGRHLGYYATALAATLGLLALLFLVGWVIQAASNGKFVLFGHDSVARDAATGRALYRPGSLLLGYYMIGFSLLLVHYLHDGVFFFRTRYIVGEGRRTSG